MLNNLKMKITQKDIIELANMVEKEYKIPAQMPLTLEQAQMIDRAIKERIDASSS